MMPRRFPLPIATALRKGLRGYDTATFVHDATAGLVVSLLALPLAMALAIAVGLPPQHGIYTAIVAGLAAALFGGSPLQVSGPTAAFVAIVAPIVVEHGLDGLIWCTILAGVFLILMGSAGLGRYIHYVPHPVTTGFTAGIAVVIATLSLNDFLGLELGQLPNEFVGKLGAIAARLPALDPYALAVGVVTLFVILTFRRITRAIPSTIAGIAAGTLLAWFLARNNIDVATIASRFTYQTAEGLRHGLPPHPPSFHLPGLLTYEEFKVLFAPALVIAALAALESLLSATVADSMADTRHDPNAELNGIGIANILTGLAAGIPATGAIARTALNIHSGAKTPVASAIHAVLVLVYVLLFAPLIGYVPMASLAALLLVTAYRMSHVQQFIRTIRIAPASDTVVLLTCFGLTVFVDMVAGVVVGIMLASLLFMKRISQMTEFSVKNGTAETDGDSALPGNVMIYHINGPLFFGTVEKGLARDQFIGERVNRLIIDLERVPLIDMTGLVAMKSMLSGVAREGREVYLCGKEEITGRIERKISDHPARRFVRTSPSVREAIAAINSESLPAA